MTERTIRSRYEERAERLTADIRKCKRLGRWLVAGQLASFLMSVLCVVAYTTIAGGYWWLLSAAVFFVSYIFVRRKDVANSGKRDWLEAARSVCMNETAYLDGNFSSFCDGRKYVNSNHEYSFDLDVFGSQSLFHRIDRTVTSGGSGWLARELSRTSKKSLWEITDQRDAISELAGFENLRIEFISIGQMEKGKINTEEVMRAVERARNIDLPSFASSGVVFVIATLSVVGFICSLIAAQFDYLSTAVPFQWGLLQLLAMIVLCSRTLHAMNKTVGAISRQMKSYVSLIEIILNSRLSAKDNKAIISILSETGSDALLSIKQLKNIIDSLDRNGNPLYRIVCDAIFLNDFFLIWKFCRWRNRFVIKIDEWIDAVSHFDALVSMATFRYNEPRANNAEIVESSGVVYEAEGMYHPFLGTKAVPNDFRISDSHYYIVTGANMAGKSTFLRSIGVNYILAMCGMPVFAKRLTVSRFYLFSSMRTTDDLAHGISYFNAELLRLEQLIEACRKNSPTLIILDEILKGTNSADKLSGSRMFLEAISELPVTGIIATHDLELSKMADNCPDRFHNYCFEIELKDDVAYSYKITPGVARNQNATYLLKRLLKRL